MTEFNGYPTAAHQIAAEELANCLLISTEGIAESLRSIGPNQLDVSIHNHSTSKLSLELALAQIKQLDWSSDAEDFYRALVTSAEQTIEGLNAWDTALQSADMMGLYRAGRYQSRTYERLYPYANFSESLNRIFVEPGYESTFELDPSHILDGITHYSNDRESRGGFSAYVPETLDRNTKTAVVFALHGGSGHGRSFLWSWFRIARCRKVILISPTSSQQTWSLMGPDMDSPTLEAILDQLKDAYHLDENRLLLTGMSDGGTFAYVSGLMEDSPFTYLAPCSASFHPFLLEGTSAKRINNLPVYILHGSLDWMFPAEVAQTAFTTLRQAGARVSYKEVPDLSHTTSPAENSHIMDWFLAN